MRRRRYFSSLMSNATAPPAAAHSTSASSGIRAIPCVRACVRACVCACACVRACVCVCVCAQKIPIRRLLGVCSRAARVLAATAIYLFIAHPVQSSATGLVLRRITVRVRVQLYQYHRRIPRCCLPQSESSHRQFTFYVRRHWNPSIDAIKHHGLAGSSRNLMSPVSAGQLI